MIAVIGGTGFLGSHLLRNLSNRNKNFIALKRPDSNLDLTRKIFELSPNGKSHFDSIQWMDADINDISSLESALKGVDQLYHTAGMVSFQKKDRLKMYKTNAEGTANLVNVALWAGVKKMCHVSSVAALGRAFVEEPISENTPWKSSPNNSNYAISKYLAEREVWRGTEEGLPSVIVNPGIILGIGNWNSGSCSLFKKVYSGLNFYTRGSNGFVDVEDVAEIMIRLMESDIVNERFVVVSENISYQKLTELMAQSFNKPLPKFEANSLMLKSAMISEKIKSVLTGQEALITPETVKNALSDSVYDNSKLKKYINFHYKEIQTTITQTANYFLKENA